MALHQSILDLLVSHFYQRLQNHNEGDQELLLPVQDPQEYAAVVQLVQGDRLRVQILAHALHLDRELREAGSPVDVARPDKAYGVVALLRDQHADQLFVAVYDKLAAELVRILVVGGQLLRGELR